MITKRSVNEFFVITLGTLIVAIAVYFFMLPSHVTVGSGAALALVISNYVPLSVSTITLIINIVLLLLGFLLIGIPRALLWAALVALVDAVPVLGTGTVLVPWALVRFLQGDVLQGAGLLATFSVAWLVRSVLEPRIVGRSLGLDPLISLVAFYVGFKLWGIPGMILAPMAAALIKSLLDNSQIIHKETS